MLTVDDVLKSIYDGDDLAAAAALGVGRTAVLNWRAWGYFPTRLVIPIWKHAKDRGIDIDIATLPVMQKTRVES